VSFDDKQQVFLSFDGVSYPKLVLNDGSNTVVARGHRSNIGLIGKPRQARLEIFPNFDHLADIILVTYILTERIRKDRERNRRRG
jgi:hypothetical protein